MWDREGQWSIGGSFIWIKHSIWLSLLRIRIYTCHITSIATVSSPTPSREREEMRIQKKWPCGKLSVSAPSSFPWRKWFSKWYLQKNNNRKPLVSSTRAETCGAGAASEEGVLQTPLPQEFLKQSHHHHRICECTAHNPHTPGAVQSTCVVRLTQLLGGGVVFNHPEGLAASGMCEEPHRCLLQDSLRLQNSFEKQLKTTFSFELKTGSGF